MSTEKKQRQKPRNIQHHKNYPARSHNETLKKTAPVVVEFLARLPTLEVIAAMDKDSCGQTVVPGMTVKNIHTIVSGAKSGDVAANTTLKVEKRSGAGFIVRDSNNVRHIAVTESLLVIDD